MCANDINDAIIFRTFLSSIASLEFMSKGGCKNNANPILIVLEYIQDQEFKSSSVLEILVEINS